jgi:predicted lipoprotein with Yx(FWY)xxD motif
MTTRKPFLACAAVLLVVLAAAGCGSGSNNSAALPTTPNGLAPTVGVSNGYLGTILVNSKGHTLYLFEKDSVTGTACTGACAAAWPPLDVNGKPTVGSGANASLIGTASRPNGSRQVTYNGHRLYRFSNDHKAGDTNGEGIDAFGGTWFAVSPAGDGMARPTANGNSGSYGY